MVVPGGVAAPVVESLLWGKLREPLQKGAETIDAAMRWPIPESIAGPGVAETALGAVYPKSQKEALVGEIAGLSGPVGVTKIGKTWANKAKKMFGVTEDITKTGWILPEGEMLNHFITHGEISRAMDKNTEKAVMNFMNEADAIRTGAGGGVNKPTSMFLQFSKKPTEFQLNKIEDALYGHNIDFLYGDIMSPSGELLDSLRIVGKSPKEIMKFLKDKIRNMGE